jgi:hypothetical protein
MITEEQILTASNAFTRCDLTHIDKCLCGECGGLIVAEKDRFGLDIKTRCCLRCGTLRSDVAVSDDGAEMFYEHYYAGMHLGLGDENARIQREERQARYLEMLYGILYFRDSDIVEYGGQCSSNLRCNSWSTVDVSNRPGPIPDEDTSCSIILSIHVMEHQPDPIGWLRRMVSRHGKPGTRIIMVVPDLLEVHHHRFVKTHGLKTWWQLAHPWNWTEYNMEIPIVRAGLWVKRVIKAAPGTFATVGSLLVEAEVPSVVGAVGRYLKEHS